MHLNAVIDISHWDGDVDFQAVAGDGILGVVQKATQGQLDIDPTYERNRANATQAGLLWGAYHFATGADGVAQAEHFLAVVGNTDNVLLALDFEENTAGSSMDLDEARAFVTHVQARTGRFPGLYGGSYLKSLIGTASDPVLVQCWLWIAEYAPQPFIPPNWQTWTFWQYTDGVHGPEPHSVNGIGSCDRDFFNGPEVQLRKLWLS
ncbi:MAG: lysozyme [Methylobacteriaceae bacterium]|jgi:lysozyme|nr:lysozyme [Methylobacteriaceae bacterium]